MDSNSPREFGGGVAAVQGGHRHQRGPESRGRCFKMPLHYPKYSKSDYENMPEWKLDCLLSEYGLPVAGKIEEKRKFVMGAFVWPH